MQGKRIYEIRKKERLTQAEFAQKLGLSATTISTTEADKTPLTEPNIRLICRTFGINEKWLRYGTGEMMDEEAHYGEDGKRLMALFDRLSPRAQDILIEYADKILSDESVIRSGETPK